jgi:2-hydroxychromene-2-carboxylate isomerase
MPQAIFYFDLGSPYAYLAAERLHNMLPHDELVWGDDRLEEAAVKLGL